jgi:cytochrome P450
MSESEAIAQMITMMLVGQETTAGSTCWILWMLAKNPEVQKKTREEIIEMRKQGGEFDRALDEKELESLKWLDGVVVSRFRFLSYPLIEPICIHDLFRKKPFG